jgi:signal transduction histidine kinase
LYVIQNIKPDTQKVNRIFNLALSFDKNNTPEGFEKLAGEALAISQKENYTRGLGMAYYTKAFVAYSRRNFQAAADSFALAQKVFEDCNDIINKGHCFYTKANVHYDMGQYPQASLHWHAALSAWQKTGFKALNGECNTNLALAYVRMGNYSKAVEFAYAGYRISELAGDKKQMAQALHILGSAFYEFKNYENALKNLQAAAALNIQIKDSFGFARNNNMMGEIFLEEGDYTRAMEEFQESFAIYSRPGGPPWGQPWSLSNMGSVHEKKGDSLLADGVYEKATAQYKMAIANYEQSLQKFQYLNDPAGTTEQMMLLGKTYFKINKITQASKYLTSGLAIAKTIGEKRYLGTTYLYLSKVDSALGNTQRAFEYFKLYVLYRDSVYNLQSSQILIANKNQLDAEKKDHEIELLAAKSKLQTLVAKKQQWQKRFAYAIGIAAILISSLGYFRYRRLNKQKAEQKRLKERLTISHDLHDQVGATLSSIAVYSKVAQVETEKGNTEKANELLGKVRETSAKIIAEMNDIVWTINPKNDSMEKIIQRMELFARPLVTARNMQFQLVYDKPVLSLNLEMEQRKNIYLIFKEAVNNAVKYSGASLLDVSITHQPGILELVVKDNGVGFNMEKEMSETKSLSGNGLKNMQARAKEMNASLSIETSADKGTRIGLVLPYM